MSQAKKLQQGGTAPAKPTVPTYKFKVDNNDFELDDNKLDSAFNDGFNQLVSSGYAKANDRNEWNQRYQTWKQQAGNGTYNIDMQGNALGALSHTGGTSPIDPQNLGVGKDGKAAKSNFLGRVFGGVDDPDKQMTLLNSVLGQHIGNLAQTKFQGDQAAVDKAKSDSNTQAAKDRTDFISKYSTYANPATALYGRDGEGSEGATWAGKQFWSQKSGQSNQLLASLGKFGSYVFDSKFNDPEYQKAFKEANKGLDINDVRSAFTKYGYNNGAFPIDAIHTNGQNIGNFLGDLGLHRVYQPFLDKKYYQESIKSTQAAPGKPGASGTGDPNLPVKPGVNALKLKDNNLYVDSNGVHYSDALGKVPVTGVFNHLAYTNGKLSNELYIPNLNEPESYENGRYLLNGIKTDKASYEAYLTKQNDPKLIEDYQNKLNTMKQTKGQFLGLFHSIDEDGLERSDNIFYKDAKAGNVPEKVADITNLFPEAYGKGWRVVNYVPKHASTDPFTGHPVTRTRLALPNGKTYDGVLGKDISGNATITASDGKRYIIGYQNNNPDPAKYTPKTDLFLENYSGPRYDNNNHDPAYGGTPRGVGDYASGMSAHKYGGIIKIDESKLQFIKKIQKAQSGGALLNLNKNGQGPSSNIGKSTSANMGELFNSNVSLSDADKMQLTGLGFDTAGLLASFTGVGSLAAAGLGAAGTTANWRSNYDRHGFEWGDVGSAALGYGLDALTAVPGLGIVSDGGKVIKGLRSASKMLGTVFTSMGAYEAVKSLSKLDNPTKMNITDWQNIVGGIQGALTGKRMLDNVVGTKKAITNTVRANGEDVTISSELVNRLSKTKSPAEQITMIKKEIAPSLGLSNPNDVNLDTKTSRNFMKMKFWQPTVTDKPIVTKSGEYQLKDLDGANNFYVRNAIKNTATMNPKLPNADKVLGRFAINESGDIVHDNDFNTRFGIFGNNTRRSLGGIKSNSNLNDVLDTRVQQAQNMPENENNWDNSAFLKFKNGGKIVKGQDGLMFPKFKLPNVPLNDYFSTVDSIKPVTNTLFKLPSVPLNSFFNQKGSEMINNTPTTNYNTPSQKAPITNIDPKSNNFWHAIGLDGVKLPKVDPGFASELGRALFIRNNNANVDINVRPAMLTHDTEISPSVHGDLYSKNLYDQRANNMVNDSAINNTTSDAGLQITKMLSVNQQAEQIRDQGQNVNNQMLYQNQGRAEQIAGKYADDRQRIANQNISNLAAADESMRQLRNMKQASMNQPIDDLWKAQDMKNEYNNQQTKQYAMQLQGAGEYANYNNFAIPIQNQMSDLQNKMYNEADPIKKKELSDQYNTLQNQASRLSAKFQYRNIALQGKLPMPQGYDPSTYYNDDFKPSYITNANMSMLQYKSGGQVATEEVGKDRRLASKEDNDRSKQFATNYEKWISDKQDNDSREGIAALKNINDIIKQALS